MIINFRCWFGLHCVPWCCDQAPYLTPVVYFVFCDDDHIRNGKWGENHVLSIKIFLAWELKNENLCYDEYLTLTLLEACISIHIFGVQIAKGNLYFCLQFALLETMMTAVQDTFPQLRAKKTYVVAVVCLIGFLGGLSVTCNVSTLWTASYCYNFKLSSCINLYIWLL